MNSRVIDIDHGFRKLVSNAKQPSYEIVAGILGESPTGMDRSSIVEIATANEFGGGHIPSRSFLRSTFDEENDSWGVLLRSILEEIMMGGGVGKLSRIGKVMETAIQKKIKSIRKPPNAPETIQRKGFNNPLIETGQLLESVSHQVRPKGFSDA